MTVSCFVNTNPGARVKILGNVNHCKGQYYEAFEAVINRAFVSTCHFHPRLIIVGKAGANPSGVSHMTLNNCGTPSPGQNILWKWLAMARKQYPS
jgi:hypothetical protein